MAYRVVLTLACLILTMHYLLDAEAAVRGRLVVGVVTVSSFFLPGGLTGDIVAIVLQLSVCVFVLFRKIALAK